MRFQDSVVVVTGATGALGAAVCRTFLAEGARVVATYQSQEKFEALRKSIPAGALLDAYRVDVADETAVLRLMTSIYAQYKRVDALVNTVGGYLGGRKLWELELREVDRMLDLNLRSCFTMSKATIPLMLKRGSGSIISVAAKAAVVVPPEAGAYAASKAAAVAMMESLANDLIGTGVRVNTILPSIMDTEDNRRAMPTANFARWPKTDDIARVIAFLCSADANVIHGAAIPVYGND